MTGGTTDRAHASDAGILRALRWEWENLKGYCVPWQVQGRMKPPAFLLGDGETQWGRWHGQPVNEITIARRLVAEYSWDAVCDVLRHEMAHQFVEQVLGVRNPQPHGDDFRKAARLFGVAPKASGSYEPLDRRLAASADGDSSGVVAKIRKLLALASSPNRHEAEAAAAKAHELAAKYNVDMLDAGRQREYFSACLGVPARQRPVHLKMLAGILRDYYFVDTIWVRHHHPSESTDGLMLEVNGTAENVLMAGYVYDFVVGFVKRQWEEFRRERRRERQPSSGDLRSFSVGVLEGFARKLARQFDEQTAHDPRALQVIRRGDPGLDSYLGMRYPRIRRQSGSAIRLRCRESYQSGIERGNELVVHRPVEEGRGSRGKHLGPGRQ